MNKRNKDTAIITVLLVAGTGLLWHIQAWQDSGRYADMVALSGSYQEWLLVVYDIGTMLILSGVLGLLGGKITDMITRRERSK